MNDEYSIPLYTSIDLFQGGIYVGTRFKVRKNRTPPPARHIFLLTVILFLASVFFSIWVIDARIKPTVMDIAKDKTREYATRTINAAVKSTENLSFDTLVDVSYDNNDNVALLGWNAAEVSKTLRDATERAEYFLYGMNQGGEIPNVDDPTIDPVEFGDRPEDIPKKDPTVIEIPIGMATGSTILANLGPKIPVHFEIIGSVQTNIVHEVKEFGVNAALFEIFIPVTVDVQIVIPFSTEVAEITTDVFVDSRVIMGRVPEFYNAGSGDGPMISVPRDSKSQNQN